MTARSAPSHFSALCIAALPVTVASTSVRKSSRRAAAPAAPPEVVFAALKLSWAQQPEQRGRTLDTLGACIAAWGGDGGSGRFLASCHRQAGLWQAELGEGGEVGGATERQILESHRKATALQPGWFTAWSSWALMNYEAAPRREEAHAGAGGDDVGVGMGGGRVI